MKKAPLFLLAASAIALASCSEDEPVSSRQATNEAISFRSAMGTRATETTNANLDRIYVTAFAGNDVDSTSRTASTFSTTPYFEHAEFDKGSDSFFTAALGKKYDWLAPQQGLKFYAYSPSQDELGADINVTEGQAGMQLESFTVAETIADQVDFITAVAQGNRHDNETTGVELTFDHRLAQIEIHAKSESDTYTYQVAGARIGRPIPTGSFDFNTNTWTFEDWKEKTFYETSCDTTILSATPVNLMGDSGNAMMIPQPFSTWVPADDREDNTNGVYLAVKVRITRTDNGYQIYPFTDKGDKREFAYAAVPLSGKWEQGKKYIYTLDFTNGAGVVDPDEKNGNAGYEILGGPIKFTVQVNDWAEQNTGKVYDMDTTIKQE